MTRKRTFAYTTIFLLALCVTLGAASPALLPLPLGFTAVFLVLLALVLLTDWLVARVTAYHRPVSFFNAVIWAFIVPGLTGGPGPALVAVVLMGLVFTAGRWRSA